MVSVLPSSFSDRVFTRTAKIYISKETRFVSRRSVELSVKKTNYTWKDRVLFFLFFLFEQRIREKFRKHTDIAKPKQQRGEAKPRGPLCGGKGERARANLYTREREEKRIVVVVVS